MCPKRKLVRATKDGLVVVVLRRTPPAGQGLLEGSRQLGRAVGDLQSLATVQDIRVIICQLDEEVCQGVSRLAAQECGEVFLSHPGRLPEDEAQLAGECEAAKGWLLSLTNDCFARTQ